MKWSGQLVPRKASSFASCRIHELEHVRRVAETQNPLPVGADAAAQKRCDLGGKLLAIVSRLHRFAAESSFADVLSMLAR